MRFGAKSGGVSSRMNSKIVFVTSRMKQKLAKVSSRMNNLEMCNKRGKDVKLGRIIMKEKMLLFKKKQYFCERKMRIYAKIVCNMNF